MDPPSLQELAIQQCMRLAGQISDIGGVRYEIIAPVLSRLNARQLRAIEHANPDIFAKSDGLWRSLMAKDFPECALPACGPAGGYRAAYESLKCEQDRHLGAARERLLRNQKQMAKARASTQIAFTEPHRPAHSSPWRSATMQQIAKAARKPRAANVSAGAGAGAISAASARPYIRGPGATPGAISPLSPVSRSPVSSPPLWSPPRSTSPQSPPQTARDPGARDPSAPGAHTKRPLNAPTSDRKRMAKSIFIRR